MDRRTIGGAHLEKAESQDGSKELVSSASSIERMPPQCDIKAESLTSLNKERRAGRGKKKSSWFNPFYPSYKSRSEDFKKLFKDVPDDERLVVDYSCALQKEILQHGRLYVTQNFVCFYANIFGWETNLTLKWKEVTAITKEKTALVIPNAIMISNKAEKYFFTSFVSRDKTYLMLFRVWQNALMDQPMTAQQMWTWVHQCYGRELGLTSEDEDYIDPCVEEDKLSVQLSVESFSEQGYPNMAEGITEQMNSPERIDLEENKSNNLKGHNKNPSDFYIPSDGTSDSDSDGEKGVKTDGSFQCPNPHEGRVLIDEIYPIHIDQLFTLLFTSSKFYLNFHALRKTTDLTQTPWTHNPLDNSKSRVVNLTVALGQTIGPKTSQVTETHVMHPCSKAGHLYSIDVDTINAGIPYADSFYLTLHYCLEKISDTASSLKVIAHLKYKKTVWGLVKGMIERNTWAGLEDFFSHLKKALHAEVEENIPDVKRKSRRKRRLHAIPRSIMEEFDLPVKKNTEGIFSADICTLIVFSVLLLLLFLNVVLYYKLWSLEDSPSYPILDLHLLKNPPKSHEDWIQLLQHQEMLHAVETQKWQKLLKKSIEFLRQAEDSLNELQESIQFTYSSKLMSTIQVQANSNGNKEEL
ncbi:GRAM domain containing 1B isoform X2 [Leptinotarsa decemlineata]|uniref:GRAM domain containing 1B isoform X2 n=1 Tax=Leptinotarsa decemlineata TaxID=7539 RepID=UPI003D304D26